MLFYVCLGISFMHINAIVSIVIHCNDLSKLIGMS